MRTLADENKRKQSGRVFLSLFLLVLVQWAVFWPATSHFLTPDGLFYVSRPLQKSEDIHRIFTRLDERLNYRPLTYVIATPLVNRAGLDPFPYHIFVLAFHSLITLLVFWFARLLIRCDAGAMVAAAFFGLHSAASHVAFDISFLPDLSYGFFFLLSLIFFIRSRWRRNARYVLSMVFFILALLSKEPSVILPLLLVILAFLRIPEAETPKRHQNLLPFFGIAVVYLAFFFLYNADRFFGLEDPRQPYRLDLSVENILSKQHYLEWGLNFRADFGSFGAHPTFSSLLEKRLPERLAEWAKASSDIYVYLIGPVWLVWLIKQQNWEYLREHFVDAMLAPFLAAAVIILFVSVLRRRENSNKVWFGILFFIILLLPALPLPRSKTMPHNLYVPVIGLGLVLAKAVRRWRSGLQGRSFLAMAIPAVFIAGGVHNGIQNWHEAWTVITSHKARTYLNDMLKSYPELPKGTTLHFKKTGDPAWPWFTDTGNLFRVAYHDPSLVTLFGDNGEEPHVLGPAALLVLVEERSGHLAVIETRKEKRLFPRIILMDPQQHQYTVAAGVIQDPKVYFVDRGEMTFQLELRERGYEILMPLEYRLTFSSLPCEVREEPDQRILLRVLALENGPTKLVLRGRRWR
ncbi:MAG: hypothetical protein HY645_15700 [Acidobacteria bacterium]|nr:hypothetical protein [Acidobacteriota bacterium]